MGNTNSMGDKAPNSQGQDSEGIVVLGAVVAVTSVIGYAVYRFVCSSNSTPPAKANATARTHYIPEAINDITGNAVIAVDATPSCGGGLLVLHKKKVVYYYSLNWSSALRFGYTPDVFEMTNAFIAMILWEVNLQNEENVTIKVDNTVFNRDKIKERNTYWNTIDSVRRDIGGTWAYVTSGTDNEHKIADKLSREKSIMWSQEYPSYEGWKVVCCDKRAGEVRKI